MCGRWWTRLVVAPIERFQTTTTSFLRKVLGYVSCPITSDSYRTDIGKCPTSDPIRLQASDDTSSLEGRTPEEFRHDPLYIWIGDIPSRLCGHYRVSQSTKILIRNDTVPPIESAVRSGYKLRKKEQFDGAQYPFEIRRMIREIL